jgi:hypothetical protein
MSDFVTIDVVADVLPLEYAKNSDNGAIPIARCGDRIAVPTKYADAIKKLNVEAVSK